MARLFKTKTLLVILAFLFGMPVFSQNVEWALYDVADPFNNFKDGIACFQDEDNRLYGGINRNGEVVIQPIYSSSFEFEDGFAVVKQGDKKGIINTQGIELLPLDYYDYIFKEDESSGLYTITDTLGKKGLFYNNRMVIPCEADLLVTRSYPLIYYSKKNNSKYFNILDGEYYHNYTGVGNVTCIMKNDEYLYFEKGTGRQLNKESFEQSSLGLKFFYDETSKKYGLIDSNGNIVKEPSYFSTTKGTPLWYNDKAIIKDDTIRMSSSCILLDASGNVLIETNKGENLDWMYFFTSDRYLITSQTSGNYEDQKYGLYTSDGKNVFPTEYKSIVYIYGDYFEIKDKNGEVYLYNVRNKKKYNGHADFLGLTEELILKMYGKEYYYIDLRTGFQTPKYKYGYDFSEGLAVVKDQDHNKLVINKKGEVVLRDNDEFKILGDKFSEGVIGVRDKDFVYGYIYNPLGHGDYVYNKKGGVSDDVIKKWILNASNLFDEERYAESKEYYFKVMMADPKRADAFIGYSACLHYMGYYDEAIETTYIALDIDPDNETAKKNLQIMLNHKQELEEQQEYYNQQNNNRSTTFWDALSAVCTVLDNTLGSGSTYHSYDYSSSYNSSSSGSYQEQYNRWEQRAKSNYESLTNLGYDAKGSDGSRSGSTGQSMSGGNYTLQKKALREAQREMRNIRQRASQAGVYIKQSKYETATVGY